jgi:RHS repeat-associated protein
VTEAQSQRSHEVRFLWDRHVPLHEMTIDGQLTTWIFEPESFAPLGKEDKTGRYSIVSEHLGTPTEMYDDLGKLAWRMQLDMFGVGKADVARQNCPWRWPGQYEDAECGLYYNRFRYYEAQNGRYLSQDPVGLLGGLAPYEYVVDPLIGVDPLGLVEERCWSSARVKNAAKEIEQGASVVYVKTREEAEELLLGLFIGKGYRSSTGLDAVETKRLFGLLGISKGKSKTYHWDEAVRFDEQLRRNVLQGHALDNPDSQFRHLQIHPPAGSVVRIFFGDPLW